MKLVNDFMREKVSVIRFEKNFLGTSGRQEHGPAPFLDKEKNIRLNNLLKTKNFSQKMSTISRGMNENRDRSLLSKGLHGLASQNGSTTRSPHKVRDPLLRLHRARRDAKMTWNTRNICTFQNRMKTG